MAKYVTDFYGVELRTHIKPGYSVVLDSKKIKRVELDKSDIAINIGKNRTVVTDTTTVGLAVGAVALVAAGAGYFIRSILD